MDLIVPVSNAIMAVGALLILWQIRQAKRQAVTSSEDSIDKEYRGIIHQIPAKALLGEALSAKEAREHLDEFFAYIDLCNQQVFLRQRKRIGRGTWQFWCDGMKSNLLRPAFKKAWETVKVKADTDFGELRRIESSNFKSDPAGWK